MTEEQKFLKAKMELASKNIQNKLEKTFLPALQGQSPKLLDAGKLTENLAQWVAGTFQKEAEKTTIKSLDVVGDIEKIEAENKTLSPIQIDMFTKLKAVLKECEDFTVAEFQNVIQWFAQAANKHVENAASAVDLEECFKTLKNQPNANSTEAAQADGSIPSPFSPKAEAEGGDIGTATAG